VGSSDTPGWVPVPVKEMTCVVGVALSVIVMVALRPLRAVGVNVAATLQLELAASEPTVRQSEPLAGVARAKSPAFVPLKTTLEIVRVVLPVFVSETICWPLATVTFWFPNGIVAAPRVATGWIAVPLRVTT